MGSATLTFAVGIAALFVAIETIVEREVYAELDARVAVAQRVLWQLIHDRGEPRIVAGKLRFGTWIANHDNSLVDHAKALTGGDATLFEYIGGRPIRVTTTILKRDGSGRNIGTELVGPARAAVDRGDSFAGISPVANRDFINRYDLLRDPTGQVIGLVYSGIPVTARDVTAARIMRVVLLVCCTTLLICAALMYAVTRPLRRLFLHTVHVARELAHGDVNQRAGARSNDEVGDINAALAEMIGYQQRMAEVADAIAAGDLSTMVAPVAVTDRLGNAFSQMLNNLRNHVERLEELASTDGLTQIGNLRAFRAEMQVQLAVAKRYGRFVTLVLVDIDKFKQINDTFGHQHGDLVLTRLATLLHTLRAQDRPYRLGGDEFAVVMPDTCAGDARIAIERLRDAAPEELFGVTLSFGLATTSGGSVGADELQRQADVALYLGKANGRNSVTSYEEAHAVSQ